MTSLHYTYIAGVIELGLRGVHVPGQLCLGKRQIHFAQYPYILVYLTAVGRYHGGKLGKYTLYLLLLLGYKLFILVAKLHHRGRLNKQRRPTAGLIVYQPRHILAVFLLYRDNKPAVAYGYQRFLKIF